MDDKELLEHIEREQEQSELVRFVNESNRIEGIHRPASKEEIQAHKLLLQCEKITLLKLMLFVSVIQPDAKLREHEGMNVRVGNYFPPQGGPHIVERLEEFLDLINDFDNQKTYKSIAQAHIAYEKIHPFMDGNGRSGRAIWLWLMKGRAPLGFLHTFYYQVLSDSNDMP